MQALSISVEGGGEPRLQARFGPQGGTIGRADHNTLVLSDPERSVSRLHARVEWRGGHFLLVNMGINPVVCNGAMLSTADEAVLADGDALRIGRFVLHVACEPHATAPEPEEDDAALFDDMTGLPLPRRQGYAATAPVDIGLLFDARSVTAPMPPMPRAPAPVPVPVPEAWQAGLLQGLGLAAPELQDGLARLGPQEAGRALRQALDAALGAAAGGAGPQTRWLVFAQALQQAAATVAAAQGDGGLSR